MAKLGRSSLMLLLLPWLALANDAQIQSAGCFIANEQGVVLVVGRVKDGLQLPAGGRQGDEPVACTAQRETFEETGLVVDVADRLVIGRKFILYRCLPREPVTASTVFEPRDWLEVKAVYLLDPQTHRTADGTLIDLDWRYWRDRSTVRWLWSRGVQNQPPGSIEPGCEAVRSTQSESSR